jgi:hypothetical protein
MRVKAIIALAAGLLAGVALMTAAGASAAQGTHDKPKSRLLPATSAVADRALLTPQNCRRLIDLPETFSNALTGVGVDLAKTHTVLAAFEVASLVDLQPDFKTLATAAAKITVDLKGVDLAAAPTPAAIKKVRAVTSELDAATITNASTYVSAWAQKNCASG